MIVTGFEIECPGYAVKADWYQHEPDSDTILMALIGRTSTKAAFGPLVSGIAEKAESNALIFDYTGHGDSPFNFDDVMPAQHALEVVMVYDWLVREYPQKKINVFGSSYGGFLAMNLVQYRNPNSLVLETPAIYNYEDFYKPTGVQRADTKTNAYRSNKAEVARHPIFTESAKYDGPVLVIVHDEDERIFKETTDTYIEAMNADKYVAVGYTHAIDRQVTSAEELDKYENIIASWLKEH